MSGGAGFADVDGATVNTHPGHDNVDTIAGECGLTTRIGCARCGTTFVQGSDRTRTVTGPPPSVSPRRPR
jgi:hypothetical protein